MLFGTKNKPFLIYTEKMLELLIADDNAVATLYLSPYLVCVEGRDVTAITISGEAMNTRDSSQWQSAEVKRLLFDVCPCAFSRKRFKHIRAYFLGRVCISFLTAMYSLVRFSAIPPRSSWFV